ncbi:MAG: VWA domain-containing protein, partial [Acidobacteria bacterium]|nr:VWA domain-containing protein [Acidobacteriota bacterium]
MRRILTAFVTSLLAFPQQPLNVSVSEVIVPITVTDSKGRFVSDLGQDDFKIYDEGKEQKITYFSRERNQ